MTALTIRNFNHKVLVVGSIYNNRAKLEKIKELDNKYELVIINGNLCYPHENIQQIENNIDFIDSNKKWIYNLGNLDLEFMNKYQSIKINNWLATKPNVIIVEFLNQTKVIILNGGISSKMTKYDLLDNIEVSFISQINKKPWHEWYGGAFGYILSNLPHTTKYPCFYKYSAQIGNEYNTICKTYAQEVDQYGLKETILIEDTNKNISF